MNTVLVIACTAKTVIISSPDTLNWNYGGHWAARVTSKYLDLFFVLAKLLKVGLS